jgi:hypothetical protein
LYVALRRTRSTTADSVDFNSGDDTDRIKNPVDAEVLSPSDVRAGIKDWLQNMQKGGAQ